MDVLSEVSVLAWAEEKTEAEEEDKRFLKLAQVDETLSPKP